LSAPQVFVVCPELKTSGQQRVGRLRRAGGYEFAEEIRNEEELDLNVDVRNEIIKNCYEAIPAENSVFGKTLVTFGSYHTAVYFGNDKSGKVYIFSKDDQTQAPTITPVMDKVKSKSNGYKYGFAPVSAYDSWENSKIDENIDPNTGKRMSEQNDKTGYYNKIDDTGNKRNAELEKGNLHPGN
jgi:hypothetical protein